MVATRAPRGSDGVEGRHAPVEAAAGRLVGARERRADHDRVGAAREGLGDVAAVAHAAVGDHVHVLAGLEHVLRARGLHVGDGRCLRDADAEHAAGRAGGARADADEHADRAGPHQVQAGGVAGAAAHDARAPATSAMNSFRLSGSTEDETCSAEITVPWITSTSSPASSAIS